MVIFFKDTYLLVIGILSVKLYCRINLKCTVFTNVLAYMHIYFGLLCYLFIFAE